MGRPSALGLLGLSMACGRGEVVELDAGKDFVCVRFARGQTECHNYDMSEGPDAAELDHAEWPSLETPSERLTSISTRYIHMCGLDRAGSVRCAGRDEFFTPIPAGSFVEVKSGNYSTCALDAQGEAHCWGLSFYEEWKPWYKGSDLLPPAGPFQHLHPHDNGWCGHRRDGTVSCWGHDGQGAASPPGDALQWFSGDGGKLYCGITEAGQVSCWGNETDAPVAQAWLSTQLPFEAISLSYRSLCVLREGGQVACRSLGGNDPDSEWTPPAGVLFQQIEPGLNFHCGLSSEDEAVDGHRVLCWGCRWDDLEYDGPARCVPPPW